MIKQTLIFIYTLILIHIGLCGNVLAWDNNRTHRDLSDTASGHSVLSEGRGNYLKKVGFDDGLDESLKWGLVTKTAKQWIQEGAFAEDGGSAWDAINGAARYNNHFHNPLRPWSAAGLSDAQSGESTVIWAQDSSGQDGSVEGDWSWFKVRYCFYAALTARTETDRQASFACTFEGLGHQMHLIQDMSVPAHVRNDAHPEDAILGSLEIDWYLESWAKKNHTMIDSFALFPSIPEVSLDVSHSGLMPITQFVDSEQYGGVMPSTSLTWGLAEYTNANFVSDDTIFTEDKDISDKHYFPYPRYSTISYYMYEVENSSVTKRVYLGKSGDGEYIEHFVTVGPLFKWLSFDPVLQKSEFKLDPLVYEDYARNLIPRAVGYSAALIDYFFRGDIDMVPDDETGSGYVIVNNTEEDMDGTFELWYDNENDERVKAWSGSFGIGKKSSSNNKSTNIIFTAPNDAKKPGKYMLVFKGEMGSEDNAVAGKMVEVTNEYLFLVSAWMHNIQVYRIGTSNGSYQLTPVQRDLNITYSSMGKNLTVQSNPEMTEHYAVLPRVSIDANGNEIYQTYQGSISRYGIGVADYCYWNLYDYICDYTYEGSPYYYRPGDFTSGGSPYVLANNGLQLNNNVYPHPVASGRRPFEADDNGLIADNISVWQDQDSFFVRFKDGNGNWVRGSNLSDGKYFAVIDRDKAMYTAREEHSQEKQGAYEEVYDQCRYIDEPFTSISSGTSEFTEKENFIFGAYPIESLEYSDNSSDILTDATTITCYGFDHNTYTDILRGVDYSENGQGRQFGTLLDYDNMNGDDYFIIFYSLNSIAMQNSGTYVPFYNPNIEFFTINGNFNSDTTEIYKMAYKVEGSPQVTELGQIMHNESRHSTFNGFKQDDYGEDTPIIELSHSTSTSGSRISNVSSQINRSSIVYTYSIETWDDGSQKYLFDKRIIGLINISDMSLPVGYRQEFELDLSGTGFDPSWLAGIGVTK